MTGTTTLTKVSSDKKWIGLSLRMKNDPEEEQQQKKRTNFKIENSLKCFFLFRTETIYQLRWNWDRFSFSPFGNDD